MIAKQLLRKIIGAIALIAFCLQSKQSIASAQLRPAQQPSLDWLHEGEGRHFLGRLLAEIPHRPYKGSLPAQELLERLRRLADADRIMRQRVAARPDADNRLWQAIVKLHLNQLDQGIELLESALGLHPQEGRLWDALAAAYLERAERNQTPQDYVRALSAAERAVRIGPSEGEAIFNRALILEALCLFEAARQDWEAFLKLKDQGEWPKEAQQHLNRLAQLRRGGHWPEVRRELMEGDDRPPRLAEIVSHFPRQARELAQVELLANWALERERGSLKESARKLDLARQIGQALHRFNGDRFIMDSVQAIDDAIQESAQQRLSALIQGHLEYDLGMKALAPPRQTDQASRRFEASRALLESHSPFALRADLELLQCRYLQLRDSSGYDDLKASLSSLLPRVQRRTYLSLQGRAEWMMALFEGVQGNFYDSLSFYRQAIATFERLGEGLTVMRLNSQLASALYLQGEFEQAWKHTFQALRAGAGIGEARALFDVYLSASDNLIGQGKPEAGLRFQDELVSLALQSQDAELASLALRMRGQNRLSLQMYEPALEDIRQAEAYSQQIPDSKIRQGIQADVWMAQGHIWKESHPKRALQLFTDALRVHQVSGYSIRVLDILFQRAGVYQRLAMPDQAEQDLAAAVDWIEKRRQNIDDQQLKLSFLQTSESIFDAMVRFQVEVRRRADLAFHYTECAKARVLLDHLAERQQAAEEGRDQQPCSTALAVHQAEGIQEALGGRALIEYAVLSDQVLVWILRAGRLDMKRLPVGRQRIEQLARRFNASILDPYEGSEFRRVSEDLYGLLLAPILGELPAEAPLMVVPDKALHRIPFAALLDPRSGRFLIESRPVGVAPSATSFLLAWRRSRNLSSQAKVLAVGNPSFDRAQFPSLPALPESEREATAVARLYPEATLLIGKQATAERFIESARQANIIHYAGHAVAAPQDPFQSSLLLASTDSGGSGRLTARRLYEERFGQALLVILSACNTAGGREYFGEGPMSLARPFLAAGVPSVLAGLWEVEDRAAARMLIEFHQELKANVEPIQALRNVQIRALKSEERASPRHWAAFQLIGAPFVRAPQ